jgi:biopolymer transport protein ExbB
MLAELASRLNLQSLLQFLHQGGDVLWLLLFLSVVLWAAIVERFWFLYRSYPKQVVFAARPWQYPKDCNAWCQRKLAEAFISQQRLQLFQGIASIKILIAVCPLLGLLGTVSGMVAVFDVIAVTGNSDAKAMADGIFKATIPTMSGLLLALSALYFHYLLLAKAQAHSVQLQHDATAYLQGDIA